MGDVYLRRLREPAAVRVEKPEVQMAWLAEAEALALSATSPGAVVGREAPAGYEPNAFVARRLLVRNVAFAAGVAALAVGMLLVLAGVLPSRSELETRLSAPPTPLSLFLTFSGLYLASVVHFHLRHEGRVRQWALRRRSRIWVVDDDGVTVCDVLGRRQRSVFIPYDRIGGVRSGYLCVTLHDLKGEPITTLRPRRVELCGGTIGPGRPAAQLGGAIRERRGADGPRVA